MLSSMASLLNLQSVNAAQRAAFWARGASGLFPGLSVRKLGGSPEAGRIGGMPFGPGRIWSVLSPQAVVNYDPSDSHYGGRQLFSVMIQLTGTTAARQRRCSCLLRAGDFCGIDNGAPFELEVPAAASSLVFLQMPRLAGRSVGQIAFAAGFADPAHFCRTFRRAFQCTPTQVPVRPP